MKILPAGDCAATVEFGNEISPAVNARVLALARAVDGAGIPGIAETVPAYRSLLVCYDPCVLSYGALAKRLRQLAGAGRPQASRAPGRVLRIPVCYGGAFGGDLPDVAGHAGLSEEEVIRLHSARPYLIYMLGFLPGFAYLGGMDKRLATPRLRTPRSVIPAGSVAIGGEQTGVYPMASPGGWRIIGRTPVRPYDPGRGEPFLYRAGDSLRFFPVTEAEYTDIAARAARGEYPVETEGGAADEL